MPPRCGRSIVTVQQIVIVGDAFAAELRTLGTPIRCRVASIVSSGVMWSSEVKRGL